MSMQSYGAPSVVDRQTLTLAVIPHARWHYTGYCGPLGNMCSRTNADNEFSVSILRAIACKHRSAGLPSSRWPSISALIAHVNALILLLLLLLLWLIVVALITVIGLFTGSHCSQKALTTTRPPVRQ